MPFFGRFDTKINSLHELISLRVYSSQESNPNVPRQTLTESEPRVDKNLNLVSTRILTPPTNSGLNLFHLGINPTGYFKDNPLSVGLDCFVEIDGTVQVETLIQPPPSNPNARKKTPEVEAKEESKEENSDSEFMIENMILPEKSQVEVRILMIPRTGRSKTKDGKPSQVTFIVLFYDSEFSPPTLSVHTDKRKHWASAPAGTDLSSERFQKLPPGLNPELLLAREKEMEASGEDKDSFRGRGRDEPRGSLSRNQERKSNRSSARTASHDVYRPTLSRESPPRRIDGKLPSETSYRGSDPYASSRPGDLARDSVKSTSGSRHPDRPEYGDSHASRDRGYGNPIPVPPLSAIPFSNYAPLDPYAAYLPPASAPLLHPHQQPSSSFYPHHPPSHQVPPPAGYGRSQSELELENQLMRAELKRERLLRERSELRVQLQTLRGLPATTLPVQSLYEIRPSSSVPLYPQDPYSRSAEVAPPPIPDPRARYDEAPSLDPYGYQARGDRRDDRDRERDRNVYPPRGGSGSERERERSGSSRDPYAAPLPSDQYRGQHSSHSGSRDPRVSLQQPQKTADRERAEREERYQREWQDRIDRRDPVGEDSVNRIVTTRTWGKAPSESKGQNEAARNSDAAQDRNYMSNSNQNSIHQSRNSEDIKPKIERSDNNYSSSNFTHISDQSMRTGLTSFIPSEPKAFSIARENALNPSEPKWSQSSSDQAESLLREISSSIPQVEGGLNGSSSLKRSNLDASNDQDSIHIKQEAIDQQLDPRDRSIVSTPNLDRSSKRSRPNSMEVGAESEMERERSFRRRGTSSSTPPTPPRRNGTGNGGILDLPSITSNSLPASQGSSSTSITTPTRTLQSPSASSSSLTGQTGTASPLYQVDSDKRMAAEERMRQLVMSVMAKKKMESDGPTSAGNEEKEEETESAPTGPEAEKAVGEAKGDDDVGVEALL